MKTAFHVSTTLLAEFEIADDALKKRMVTEAVRIAQSLELQDERYAIVNVPGVDVGIPTCDFKLLVRLSPSEITIMTAKEADDSELTQLKTEPGG